MIDQLCRGVVVALGLSMLLTASGALALLGAALWAKAVIKWVENFQKLHHNTRVYAVWVRVLRRYKIAQQRHG
ncbi:MAG: hypothetical protein ACFB0C_19595 [Leptolyngbyaceae cyanobacterium]